MRQRREAFFSWSRSLSRRAYDPDIVLNPRPFRRWAAPLIALALSVSGCLLDDYVWRSQIKEARITQRDTRREYKKLETIIHQVEDFDRKKDFLKYRLDAIAELKKKRTTTYESLMAAIPPQSGKPYVSVLTASGDLFHVSGAADAREDVDAYVNHLKSTKSLQLLSQTLSNNRFNDFAVHGRLIR